MQPCFPFPQIKRFWSTDEDDGEDGSSVVEQFFIALAGQTTDYVLLSGAASDGVLQAGH